MAECEVEVEERAEDVDALIDDPVPVCPSCGGQTLFTGHETPDKWNPLYKWWFLCRACQKVFCEKHDRKMRILFSTKR